MWGRVLVSAALCVAASAQIRVAPEQVRRMEVALREAEGKQTLPCEAGSMRPFLDFAFRFEIGYEVHCPLKEFGGEETPLAAYLRVQTSGMPAPAWFNAFYRVPGIPKDIRSRVNLLRDHNDINFSGVVVGGEGEYAMDLVVVDRRHRLFHRSWKSRVSAHGGESRAPVSMPPNTVDALAFPDCRLSHSSERPLHRLTVLVDAVPIHTGSMHLRAWDRAFLMEALSSVRTQLPSESVRVVAFNLDQQREFYDTDDFNSSESKRFSAALDGVELGKVSVQALRESQVASSMLLDLLAREISSTPRSDAIVLLGPANRLNDKIPAESVSYHSNEPPVFYLKYSAAPRVEHLRVPFSEVAGMRDDLGNELARLQTGADNNGNFPDIVQHAAALHGGITMNLHSPVDLADALRKIDRQLHPGVSVDADKVGVEK